MADSGMSLKESCTGLKSTNIFHPMSGGSSASPPDAFDQLPSSAHSVEQDSAKGHCSGNPTSETLSSFDPSFGRKYTMASSSASLPALAGIPVVLKLSALLPADPDKDCDPKKLDYDEVPRDVTEHALNEARLYQGGLKDLQGTVVPRCYGAFTADLESGGSVFGLIPEHLGEPPPQEFLTGLHNLHKSVPSASYLDDWLIPFFSGKRCCVYTLRSTNGKSRRETLRCDTFVRLTLSIRCLTGRSTN